MTKKQAVETRKCPTCSARPWHRCRKVNGKGRATALPIAATHVARIRTK